MADHEVEVYVPPRFTVFNDTQEAVIVHLIVDVVSGTLFESVEAHMSFKDKDLMLQLVWSPSRARTIKYNELNGKSIEPSEHPLWGKRNEQAGLYHDSLPGGCYILYGIEEL